MKINTQHQQLISEAQELKKQAIDILASEGLSAEQIEQAERMLADAEAKVTTANRIGEIAERASNLAINKTELADFSRHDSDDVANVEHKQKQIRFGEWLLKVRRAGISGFADPKDGLVYIKNDMQVKDLNEGSGATGGYLVPRQLSPMLMREVMEKAIVRPRAMVIPMASKTLEVPALKQDGTAAGQPHEFGGMIVFWESEAATIQETEPAFRSVMLTANMLTAVTHTSNELLDDSAMALEAILTGPRGFPAVIAWFEDYAFLRGTGAGQPLGILNAGATLGESRAGGGTIAYDDLLQMLAKGMPSENAIWVASQSVMATLMQINGPSGNASYLWGSMKDGVPNTLLGRPIIFTEKLPALGSKGDIILADFSHYYIGDRQTITIDSTTQARWLRNQTSWRVTHRVDGRPWLNAPFTLADGVTQVSPFVVLNA